MKGSTKPQKNTLKHKKNKENRKKTLLNHKKPNIFRDINNTFHRFYVKKNTFFFIVNLRVFDFLELFLEILVKVFVSACILEMSYCFALNLHYNIHTLLTFWKSFLCSSKFVYLRSTLRWVNQPAGPLVFINFDVMQLLVKVFMYSNTSVTVYGIAFIHYKHI